MNTFTKHLRISVASIFLYIGHKIDARDIHDLEAELNRMGPRVSDENNPSQQLT